MNVVYGRQLKVSLELKRRLTTSTAVHLLVSLTAIIKFGLKPMDPIFKNGRCLDVYKKTLRTIKIQLSALYSRDGTKNSFSASHDE